MNDNKVFFVSDNTGVLYDIKDKTQKHLVGHVSQIKSMCGIYKYNLIITGESGL